ncbi:hypothetical protein [Catenulispora pinisilvae]|nr:hypothetical protein [Catenulispora pinisilvae]
MDVSKPSTAAGLVIARNSIKQARVRSAQPSDGGGTGRSDLNDNRIG